MQVNLEKKVIKNRITPCVYMEKQYKNINLQYLDININEIRKSISICHLIFKKTSA